MPSEKSKINKILVISLTNIGDVVLTFPVIDILKRDFPHAELSVVVGPKAEPLLKGNPHFRNVYVFDKHQPVFKTLSWVYRLRRERFGVVVDLRHTAIPFLISPRHATPFIRRRNAGMHMKKAHLDCLGLVHAYGLESEIKYALRVPENRDQAMRGILKDAFGEGQKYVVVAPGAADQAKRWKEKGFAEVCYQLVRRHYMNVVLVGDGADSSVAQRIVEILQQEAVLNLCGRTSLIDLAALLSHCSLAIVNDSAPMHLASYLDVPVLALFGPTDAARYGPWSGQSCYIKKDQFCPACQNPGHASRHTCLESITSKDVLDSFQIVNNKVVLGKQ